MLLHVIVLVIERTAIVRDHADHAVVASQLGVHPSAIPKVAPRRYQGGRVAGTPEDGQSVIRYNAFRPAFR